MSLNIFVTARKMRVLAAAALLAAFVMTFGASRAHAALGGTEAAYAPAESFGAGGLVACIVGGHTRFVANTMCDTLFRDVPGLHEKERIARAAGRDGVALGANITQVGLPLAVGAATAAGGSLTAGLATIGGVVGMATVGGGFAVVLAAPVAACGVVGGAYYGVTKLIKYFTD